MCTLRSPTSPSPFPLTKALPDIGSDLYFSGAGLYTAVTRMPGSPSPPAGAQGGEGGVGRRHTVALALRPGSMGGV